MDFIIYESKIPYETIEKDTLWVAKMQGCRMIGTYDEIGSLRKEEDCRDFDIAAKQPEHLRDFYDKYFKYNGFITLKDFYDQFYNPESFAKESPDNNDYLLDT